MKRALFFLCAAANLAAQESISVLDVIFLPPEFYVGDLVEMRVKVNHPNPEALLAGSEMPVQDWLDIRRVDVNRRDRETWVHISFVSFSPGTRAFPEIRLGAGRLRDLSITTASVLSDDLTLAPYRETLPLAGTENQITLLLLAVLGLPALFFFLVNFGAKAMRRARSQWAARHPFRVLFNDLKHLRKRSYGLTTQEFYSTLGLSIREWLARLHTDVRMLSLTAEEWGTVLGDLQVKEPLVWKDLLQRCERWVYSGGENLVEAKINDLDRTERTALEEQQKGADNAGV